jgi:hypothetical protein
MTWSPQPLPAHPLQRIPIIIWNLLIYIGQKHRPDIDMEYLGQVYWYVDRVRRRFARLAERFRDGTLCPPPPRARPSPNPTEADTATPRPRPGFVPPRDFAWLCGLVPQWASDCGRRLEMALDTEEMKAMAEAGPQVAGVLRPLMWALGVTQPDYLNPRPRPALRAPKTPPIPPAPTPAPPSPSGETMPGPARVYTPSSAPAPLGEGWSFGRAVQGRPFQKW